MTAGASGKRRRTFVAPLRRVNVSGRHKVPMAELRTLCTSLGCENVRTYIQSGNLVFESDASDASLASHLEPAIERDFGFGVPVTARNWRTVLRLAEMVRESADA